MNFIEFESAQKLRGGYYTPQELSDFLAKWISENKCHKILEPSCGDGNFLESIKNISLNNKQTISITALEIDMVEAEKAKSRCISDNDFECNIKNEEALQWLIDSEKEGCDFDAVVGNPPFVRYQYLPKDIQDKSEQIFKLHDLKFTKHTNLWVPFVIASVTLLKPNGLFGMVLPAEILHVKHAHPLRKFLRDNCKKILIIDPEEIWFEDTLQGAVIVMAQKKSHIDDIFEGLKILPVKGKDFLNTNPSAHFEANGFDTHIDADSKWTHSLLTREESDLIYRLMEHKDVLPFEELASVDVGIVTGANNFFLVSDEAISTNELQRWTHPMFGRSDHVSGVIYDEAQYQQNREKNLPTNFLWFNVQHEDELDAAAKKYVKSGEDEGLNLRYKCRIRKPWFKVPSIYATKIGMLKRAHDIPKLILNEISAFTTDTAYRIRPKTIKEETLVYLFINSLTALSAELEGRHYGGGVLELVPSEIEKVLIPIPKNITVDLAKLNELVKNEKAEKILKIQDEVILQAIGLTHDECQTIFNAWNRLRNRRQRN